MNRDPEKKRMDDAVACHQRGLGAHADRKNVSSFGAPSEMLLTKTPPHANELLNGRNRIELKCVCWLEFRATSLSHRHCHLQECLLPTYCRLNSECRYSDSDFCLRSLNLCQVSIRRYRSVVGTPHKRWWESQTIRVYHRSQCNRSPNVNLYPTVHVEEIWTWR